MPTERRQTHLRRCAHMQHPNQHVIHPAEWAVRTTTSGGVVEARLVSTSCLLFADLSRYIVDVSIRKRHGSR